MRNVSSADNFFPVTLFFSSASTFAGLTIESVSLPDGTAVDYSTEVDLSPEAYEYI